MNCSYKTICEYYKPHCVEKYCWRAKYVNGMFKEEFKKFLKEGRLEKILGKNNVN